MAQFSSFIWNNPNESHGIVSYRARPFCWAKSGHTPVLSQLLCPWHKVEKTQEHAKNRVFLLETLLVTIFAFLVSQEKTAVDVVFTTSFNYIIVLTKEDSIVVE
jgi:hypothetical protein